MSAPRRRRALAVAGIAAVAAPVPAAPAAAAGADGPIVFASARAGGRQLFAVNPDGSNLRQLTAGPGNNFSPAVSPDGTTIAFSSTRSGDSELWLSDIDGSDPRQLTSSPGPDTDPAWSPDGSRLAFASSRTGDTGQVHTMAADGSGVVRLTDGPGANVEPTWSSDGSRIAFRSTRDRIDADENNNEIYVMNVDGSQQRNLTRSFSGETAPSWSPDGARIAYARDGDGIWTIAPDGSGAGAVTTGPRDAEPVWSPSGQQLAFTGTGEELGPDLDLRVVALAAPDQQTTPAPAAGIDTTPAWGALAAAPPMCPADNPDGPKPQAGSKPGALEPPYEVPANRLQTLEISPKRFVPARRGGAVVARRRAGARIDFRLTDAGIVRFSLRRASGPRRRPPGFSVRGAQGRNSLRFSGRAGGKALLPGRWRLLARGQAGRLRTVRFRIVARD